MKNFPPILIILLILTACSAQNEDMASDKPSPRAIDQISSDSLPASLPIFYPEFEDSIAAKFTAGVLPRSRSYHKLLQIGRYQKVKEQTELALNWGLDTLNPSEANYIQQLQLKNAYNVILSQADQHEVIILTEAHTKPEHRVFASQLLKGLYDKGFRYLGLENILPHYNSPNSEPFDSSMQERGYPLLSNISGIYSSEPHYANIIRTATSLGMKIFAYENNGSSESERDLQQAEHVIDFQKRHPDGKIICYGGWYHAIEEKIEKYQGSNAYWLAYHYKNLTGDDPLTIYQDAFNHKQFIPSSPYYELLRDQIEELDYPHCLVDSLGNNYNGYNLDLPFDILTVMPPIAYYEEHLPMWLHWYTFRGEHKMSDLSTHLDEELSYPIIMSIREYYASEIATPIHAYQLDERPANAFHLPLKPGWYWLEIKERTGESKLVEVEIK